MTDRIVAPIVVFGAPRSGTTFLAGLLGSHAETARTREARLVWRSGNDRRPDELTAADATPTVVEHIHHRLGALIAEAGGGRLVEKTPANSVRPWFVDAVFPDARYVHITRDGWACIPSIRDFWVARATGFDAKQRAKARRRLREVRPAQVPHYAAELARRMVPLRGRVPMYGVRVAGLRPVAHQLGVLEGSALQWQACVTRASAFGRDVGPDRYLEVKLEELDAVSFEALVAFCGLGPDAGLLDRFRATYDAAAAARRRPLSDAERRRLAPYVEPVNEWLGYPARAPT